MDLIFLFNGFIEHANGNVEKTHTWYKIRVPTPPGGDFRDSKVPIHTVHKAEALFVITTNGSLKTIKNRRSEPIPRDRDDPVAQFGRILPFTDLYDMCSEQSIRLV